MQEMRSEPIDVVEDHGGFARNMGAPSAPAMAEWRQEIRQEKGNIIWGTSICM